MSKLYKYADWKPGRPEYSFYCPGCKCSHNIWLSGSYKWDWNGNVDKPTFNPSIKVTYPNKTVCHFFVRDGKIQYLNDCYHELAGKTVEMKDVE